MAETALSLHAEVSGDPTCPPLVILHGLFGQARNWGGIVRALSDQAQLHVLDLRNHGRSPHDPVMTYPAMAADLAAYLRQSFNAPIAVLGHSMGGKVAMRLALEEPGLVDRLMVVDIAPVAYPFDHAGTGFASYIDAMLAVPLSELSRRQEVDAALKDAIPEAAIRAFLTQNVIRDDAGSLIWQVNLPVLKASLNAIYDFPAPPGARYEGPTHFLRGGKSAYVASAYHEAIAGLFPHATHQMVDGVGHWVHAEAPQVTVEAIRSFML